MNCGQKKNQLEAKIFSILSGFATSIPVPFSNFRSFSKINVIGEAE